MRTLGKTFIIFLPLLVIIIPFSCKDSFTESSNTNFSLYMSVDDARRFEKLDSLKSSKNTAKMEFGNILDNFDFTPLNAVLYADSCVDLTKNDTLNVNNP